MISEDKRNCVNVTLDSNSLETDWKSRANPMAPSVPSTQQAWSFAATCITVTGLKFRNILYLQVL